MSGLTDLSGIAARAYTPGTKPTRPAAETSKTPEDKRSVRSEITDRRLAPAFSIQLSLAAQKVLGETKAHSTVSADSAAAAHGEDASTSYARFSDGVGRREAPLANEQRDVAPGSRLNIRV